MATALCDFGCSGTVELPAPDAMGHNCPVHTAKAFEFLLIPFRPKKGKAAFGTLRYIFIHIFGQFIMGVTTRTDQMG
jgi:hypothetical protein